MSLLSLIRVPLGMVMHSPTVYKGRYQSNTDALKSRQDHIDEMKKTEYDVVIIGAGATGAGLAVECATRGLKAVVVDANDYAAGTSSKSTKLIHGGIRYLEAAMKNLDVAQLKLVFEGLRERSHMRIAGGNMLTKPVGMFIKQNNIVEAMITSIGVRAYQVIAKIGTPGGNVLIPDSKLMGPTLAGHLVDCAKKWKRSLLFFDGAHIDQRSVMHLINTATQADYVDGMVPANAANYLPVIGTNSDSNGRVVSVKVTDLVNSDSFDIKGKLFINCTGPFSDAVRQLSGKEDKYISASSGIHLMFPKRILNEYGGNTGVLIPKTSRGSVCFILPYQDYCIAGTTDVKEPSEISPTITKDEVQYLCSEIAGPLGVESDELERSIVSSWKGFRPLVAPPASGDDVSKVVRSHLVHKETENFYSLMGGKWTSYREMGQDAMDLILDTKQGLFGRKVASDVVYTGKHAEELKAKAGPSRTYGLKWSAATQSIKLRNAHYTGLESNEEIAGFAGLLSRQFDVDESTAQRLMRCYGFFSWDLLLNGRNNDSNSPLHNIPFNSRILASEVEWLCDKEQGIHVDDIVSRRLGLSFLDVHAATACIPEVALIMKRKYKWNNSTMNREIKDCARQVQKMAYHPINALDLMAE